MTDLETTGADVTEVPTPAEPTGDGAVLETPENTETPAPDDKPTGFSSAFRRAAEKVAAPAEGSDEADDEGETPEEEADAQIPADDDKGEAPTDDASKPEDKGDKTPRTRKHTEVVAENERLTTEIGTVNARLEKLDTQFKEYGGVDVVETAMQTYERLATGKALEVFAELPTRERTAVQKAVFEQAMAMPENRVFGVNHVLKSDFGLEKDIPQAVLEKVFEFVTFRLNDDPADFDAYLDRELEFVNTPEKQLARLQAENERLKNPAAQPDQGEKPATDESPIELTNRVNAAYNKFEDDTFATIADAELKAYGLAVTSKDTPAIKQSKETLAKALHTLVGFEMRTTETITPLLPFFADNEVESPWFKQAAGAFERTMRARTQKVLKDLSKLIGAAKPAPSAATPPAQSPKIPAPGGKTTIPVQAPKKDGEGGGFKSAFANSRKAAGLG